MKRIALLMLICLALVPAGAWAADALKPFNLVSKGPGEMDSAIAETKAKLEQGGFEVLGEYSPYEGAHVIAVTNDELLSIASKSEFGGYGAAIRVSVTKAGDDIAVAYANPSYWAAAFRMEDVSAVADKMASAMGASEPFGSEEGLTESKLRKYHYMAFMPYFDDHDELGEFSSHSEALAKVNENLAAGKNDLSEVFEVAVPGKEEVLIGVAIGGDGPGSDQVIMSKIDLKSPRHTAHLPYAVLVSGNNVYSLAGKFRIALSFPDLSMMGTGSFAQIMDAPGAIEETLETLTK
jgi:hypothetical protein